jgi:hypothetical protein
MVTINNVKLETSHPDVEFLVSYSDKKWLTQLVFKDEPRFPIIPSTAALYELNEKRDAEVTKVMINEGIDSITTIPLLREAMCCAGKKADEMDLLRRYGKKNATTSIKEKYDEKIIERATLILEQGDPFKFYIDKWKNTYAVINGDDSIGAMTLCVIASTIISNSKGLHEKIGGPSGFGKSAAVTKMFALIPSEKTFVSSMSPKSLFYKELDAGTVVYCDDIDLSKPDIFSTVKQSTSDYQKETTHTSVFNATSIDCVVAPRIGWIMSSVDNFDDEQLDSRFGDTEVADDVDIQQAIFEKQQEEEWSTTKAGELDEDTLVCMCMWDMIQSEDLYEIRIPFARSIKWTDIKHPRSFPFFKDLIRCMTLFKIKQREKYNDFYLATIEDFEAAKQMYKKMEHVNATKLNTNELAVLTYLKDRYNEFMEAICSNNYSKDIYAKCGKVSRMELVGNLSKTHNMTQQRIIYIIHGKNESGGLLNKIPGLQAEKMANNAFGGNPMWWYWYVGDITADGFTDSILVDRIAAEREIVEWKKHMK